MCGPPIDTASGAPLKLGTPRLPIGNGLHVGGARSKAARGDPTGCARSCITIDRIHRQITQYAAFSQSIVELTKIVSDGTASVNKSIAV